MQLQIVKISQPMHFGGLLPMGVSRWGIFREQPTVLSTTLVCTLLGHMVDLFFVCGVAKFQIVDVGSKRHWHKMAQISYIMFQLVKKGRGLWGQELVIENGKKIWVIFNYVFSRRVYLLCIASLFKLRWVLRNHLNENCCCVSWIW